LPMQGMVAAQSMTSERGSGRTQDTIERGSARSIRARPTIAVNRSDPRTLTLLRARNIRPHT
jgi:hypothetical protein